MKLVSWLACRTRKRASKVGKLHSCLERESGVRYVKWYRKKDPPRGTCQTRHRSKDFEVKRATECRRSAPHQEAKYL